MTQISTQLQLQVPRKKRDASSLRKYQQHDDAVDYLMDSTSRQENCMNLHVMYISQLSRCHGSNNIEWKNRDASSLGEYQERDHILDFMDSRKLIQCFEFSIKIKIYKKLEYKTRCFQPQRVSAARQCCRILLDLISQMFPNVSNQTDSRNFDYDVCDMMF